MPFYLNLGELVRVRVHPVPDGLLQRSDEHQVGRFLQQFALANGFWMRTTLRSSKNTSLIKKPNQVQTNGARPPTIQQFDESIRVDVDVLDEFDVAQIGILFVGRAQLL